MAMMTCPQCEAVNSHTADACWKCQRPVSAAEYMQGEEIDRIEAEMRSTEEQEEEKNAIDEVESRDHESECAPEIDIVFDIVGIDSVPGKVFQKNIGYISSRFIYSYNGLLRVRSDIVPRKTFVQEMFTGYGIFMTNGVGRYEGAEICVATAEEMCLADLRQKAQDRGANAIVGLRVQLSEVLTTGGANGLSHTCLMVAASGTAVVVKDP